VIKNANGRLLTRLTEFREKFIFLSIFKAPGTVSITEDSREAGATAGDITGLAN
jgi:hypothetical protein